MKVIIIGGAGFIGSNAAKYYAEKNNEVIIFDNLSRKGSHINLKYLQKNYSNIKFINGDITNVSDIYHSLAKEMEDSNFILHLAAQVAVTTSVKNPREDFNINAMGTFNVLEALRTIKEKTGNNPLFLYSSTNKVYGEMKNTKIIEKDNEYGYENLLDGIGENELLDFHSPYGCSKGTGDQYVRDYHRIYGLKTVVFRQSCIYGERQFGVEDQGWVAWFIIASILKKPITIFGDGKQVRDVLWVEDLINVYDLALQNIEKVNGKVYNIGGGPKNTLSLLRLVSTIEDISKEKIVIPFSEWRPGDQKVCIMNTKKVQEDLGWRPTVNPEEGVRKLYDWVINNKEEIESFMNLNL